MDLNAFLDNKNVTRPTLRNQRLKFAHTDMLLMTSTRMVQLTLIELPLHLQPQLKKKRKLRKRKKRRRKKQKLLSK